MLGGDEFILELLGLFEGALKYSIERSRRRRLRGAAAYLGQLAKGVLYFCAQLRGGYAHFFEDRNDDALAVFNERGEQMKRQDFRIAVLVGELAGRLHRFLRFDRKFFPTNCHDCSRLIRNLNTNKSGRGAGLEPTSTLPDFPTATRRVLVLPYAADLVSAGLTADVPSTGLGAPAPPPTCTLICFGLVSARFSSSMRRTPAS